MRPLAFMCYMYRVGWGLITNICHSPLYLLYQYVSIVPSPCILQSVVSYTGHFCLSVSLPPTLLFPPLCEWKTEVGFRFHLQPSSPCFLSQNSELTLNTATSLGSRLQAFLPHLPNTGIPGACYLRCPGTEPFPSPSHLLVLLTAFVPSPSTGTFPTYFLHSSEPRCTTESGQTCSEAMSASLKQGPGSYPCLSQVTTTPMGNRG